MVYKPQYHSMFQNARVSTYDTTNMHVQKVLVHIQKHGITKFKKQYFKSVSFKGNQMPAQDCSAVDTAYLPK